MKRFKIYVKNFQVHLFVGVSGLTHSRVQSVLSNKAHPIIITHDPNVSIPTNLKKLVHENKIPLYERQFDLETDLLTLGRSNVGRIVDRLYVNLSSNYSIFKQQIFEKCQIYRIPINTTESLDLSTFTLLSSYSDGDFQFGVTTSGKGCKLANRIKREIISQLPKDLGKVCTTVGGIRQRIKEEDRVKLAELYKNDYEEFLDLESGEHEEDSVQNSRFNTFISEFNMTEAQKKLQRSRWLSQVVEYYPFSKLASLSIDDLSTAYHNSNNNEQTNNNQGATPSQIGAGPGSVSLLTLGALSEINTADIVLADKLVPQQVLDLIPSKTERFIARKFPGNAEAAQEELLQMGITSALSSTVNSKIPATQRDVADQVLICTGTGRRGVLPNLPEFVKSRTTVFLMALHRISDLVPELIAKGWDPKVPATIVERSSCPDQRITRTRLEDLVDAVEAIGSRPPGLLVVGYACEVLNKPLTERWVVEEGYESNDSTVSGILESLKA
ncbi:unnamed protein product [Wickerhamomyces anomalus]